MNDTTPGHGKADPRLGICALCDGTYTGHGHNPEPLASHPARCCDTCNTIKVIPARLRAMRS